MPHHDDTHYKATPADKIGMVFIGICLLDGLVDILGKVLKLIDKAF